MSLGRSVTTGNRVAQPGTTEFQGEWRSCSNLSVIYAMMFSISAWPLVIPRLFSVVSYREIAVTMMRTFQELHGALFRSRLIERGPDRHKPRTVGAIAGTVLVDTVWRHSAHPPLPSCRIETFGPFWSFCSGIPVPNEGAPNAMAM